LGIGNGKIEESVFELQYAIFTEHGW